MDPTLQIRLATPQDARAIAHHRVAMFRDMKQLADLNAAATLMEASERAIASAIADGTYLGWLVVTPQSSIVAGAGVHIKPQLPRLSHNGTRVATTPIPLVVNVYTEVEWRKQGIARALMRAIMQWAMDRGCDRVLLHASDAGRPLYLSLGFSPTNEMRWVPAEPHDRELLDD